MAMNLYDIFHATARRQPDHPALLGPGADDRLSYGDLDEAIRTTADRLDRAGVRPGDGVGLHCPSGADYIILNYAVWRRGGCVVPIPVELTAGEQQEILREIALEHVISRTAGAGKGEAFWQPFRRGDVTDLLRGAAVLPVASPRQHPPGFHDVNGAFIRFTSGTTAASKGVVLSHETILDRIAAANEALGVGPDDRVVWLLSMSYHFAVSIVSYLSFGAAILLPANHFPQAVLAAAGRHQGTLIYGSPAHYDWLAAAEPGAALPGLRLAVSTTAPLTGATAARFHRHYGLPVTQALGIIEVGLPFINTDCAGDRPEAVGRVLPAYRLRLEDVGLGPRLKEIQLAGKGFLDAYYQPWRPRAEVMPDGWFRTGDVGEVDADGCLFLRGRTKDVISVLGMKFFPQEVEAVLRSHPRVEGACVFARRDGRLGEVPWARVVARAGGDGPPSEAELLEHCRQRLAGFKVPQRVEFVDRLPRTASGKVLHRDLTGQAEPSRGEHEPGPPGFGPAVPAG
jgi:long-chain acyl-CoA synthetase